MSGSNWEYQAPEVIAKEILITMIERGYVNTPSEIPKAQSIGEMYNVLLEEIRKSVK